MAGCAGSPSLVVVDFSDVDPQYTALLEQAEAKGAVGAAPKTYKKTRQALLDVQAVIERDPKNKEAIQAAIDRFVFEAKHLLHVTDAVKELRALNNAAMENIFLAAELRLLAISDALRQPDPRQYNLREQSVMISKAADELYSAKNTAKARVPARPVNKNELDSAYLLIEQLQAQMRDLQKNNDKLEASKKPLLSRIDALERGVIELNNEKAALEEELAKALAVPEGGVEIIPIQK